MERVLGPVPERDWAGIDLTDPSQAAILTYTELVISVVVLVMLGFLMKIKNNEKALITVIALMAGGSLLIGFSTMAYQAGMLDPYERDGRDLAHKNTASIRDIVVADLDLDLPCPDLRRGPRLF